MTPNEIFSTHRNSSMQNLTRHSKFIATNTYIEVMPEISRVSKLSSLSNERVIETDELPHTTDSNEWEPETLRHNPNSKRLDKEIDVIDEIIKKEDFSSMRPKKKFTVVVAQNSSRHDYIKSIESLDSLCESEKLEVLKNHLDKFKRAKNSIKILPEKFSSYIPHKRKLPRLRIIEKSSAVTPI